MSLAAWVALGLAVLSALTLAGVVRGRWHMRQAWQPGPRQKPREQVPRVVLLRPCAGAEPMLEHCLLSAGACQRAGLEVHVVMLTASETDTAMPVAQNAAATLRAGGLTASCRVVPPRGPNRKASLLAGALEAYPEADVVLVADSNVDLRGLDLLQMVQPLLDEPTLGAVWVPPVQRRWADGPLSSGARASEAVLNGSLHAFPLLSALDARGMVGKLFGFEPRAVAAAGGLDAVVDVLGEDMELARRLREAGFTTRSAPFVAPSYVHMRELGAAVDRYARWMAVIRGQRPHLLPTYPLFFAPLPLVLVLSAVGAAALPQTATLAVGVALSGRTLVALTARWLAGDGLALRHALGDILLAEIVLSSAFVRVLRSRELAWRGTALRVDRGGKLRVVRDA